MESISNYKIFDLQIAYFFILFLVTNMINKLETIFFGLVLLVFKKWKTLL
jgi:hypothetical protein